MKPITIEPWQQVAMFLLMLFTWYLCYRLGVMVGVWLRNRQLRDGFAHLFSPRKELDYHSNP